MKILERPIVGVGVIIIRDNKEVLLGLRNSNPGKGTWASPGGRLELGESFYDCGEREVREETGLEIDILKEDSRLPVTNNVIPDQGHFVTIFIRANYLGGEPRIMEPDKCLEWKWFNWEKLPSGLYASNSNLIKQGYDPFRNENIYRLQ
ncbi:MAG: NUDIX domain-containing protein [Candidatus Pacearchaeota archaeon]